jgi:hypothetical protein
LVSCNPDRSARGAGHRVRAQTDRLNYVYDRIDIARGGARFHYDQHIFKKGWLFSLTQTQISLGKERESQRPLRKRPLLIATSRAPVPRQGACRLSYPPSKAYQRSLPTSLTVIFPVSILNFVAMVFQIALVSFSVFLVA